jgi:hypothetical protein
VLMRLSGVVKWRGGIMCLHRKGGLGIKSGSCSPLDLANTAASSFHPKIDLEIDGATAEMRQAEVTDHGV